MKLAIAYGPKRNVISDMLPEEVANDPQRAAEAMDLSELGGFPHEILIVSTIYVPSDGHQEGRWESRHTARYIRGQDFSERVESLDSAAETIKTWIDNLDDPKEIADILHRVTGAMDIRIIGEGESAQIAYDIPYDKD